MPSLKRSSDALTFTNGTRGWKSIDIHVVHVYIDKQRVWSLISQSNIKCQGFSDFLQFLWCFLSLSFHRKPLFHQCLLDRDVHWSDSTQYHVPSCPSKDPSRHASSYCGGPHEQIPLLGRLRTDPQNRASFSRRFQPDRAGFLGHRHPQRPGFGPPRWIHLLGGWFPGHDRTSPTRGGRDRGRTVRESLSDSVRCHCVWGECDLGGQKPEESLPSEQTARCDRPAGRDPRQHQHAAGRYHLRPENAAKFGPRAQ